MLPHFREIVFRFFFRAIFSIGIYRDSVSDSISPINSITTNGDIMNYSICAKTKNNTFGKDGYKAIVSYDDEKGKKHTIKLPCSDTNYIYYSAATVTYEKENPKNGIITQLDDTEVRITSINGWTFYALA